MTREIFEQIFLVPFLKDRPAWLKNSRGGQMELDGYSEELKVAFEYQGYQHFTVDNFRIKKASTLMKRKLDDEEKRKLCEERGILLIQVPEVKLSAGIDGFLAAIRKAYPKIDTFITGKITVDPRRVYTSKFEEKASRLREAVESRGGVLLSSFVDKKMFHRAKVKCDVGHVWSARANHLIAMASWCPYCSKKAKRTIEDMRAVAKLKGGDCLSKKYVSLKKKLLWRCAAGHEWLAVPSNIAHSPSWCPFCSGRRKS